MATSKRCTETNNLELGIAKEIAGQADNSDKPRGGGGVDINNLEMAVKTLAWFVLEVIIGTKNLRYKHVGVFSNNMAAVSCTQRGAEKKSASAVCLIRFLALR